jgi:hypothetical protein
MDKEYIEREKVMEIVKRTSGDYAAAWSEIRQLPAADVAPVVHGGWEWYEKWIPSTTEHPAECQAFGWRCGNCKRDAQDMGFGYWDDPTEKPLMIYCPVCGAKMDGGK